MYPVVIYDERTEINVMNEGISEEIKNFVIDQAEEKHSDDRIGVSELGLCIRKAWYKRRQPRRLDFEKALPIFIGKLFHEYIERGYSRTEVFVQHKVGDVRIIGKIDAIEGNTVIDFKSKRDVFWIERKGPLRSDVSQVKFYAFASNIKKAKLIYYRVNPEIMPADNVERFEWIMRRKIVSEVRNQNAITFDIDARDVSDVVRSYERLALILSEALKENKPPEPNAQRWECKYCEYRDICDFPLVV